MGRTVITVKASDSVWPKVESWAERNEFKEIDSGEGGRSFRRVTLLGGNENLRVDQSEDEVTIESWLHTGLFLRIWFCFLWPKEMGIKGGIWAQIPKKKFREKLNPLLEQLGGPTL